jgi:hypothetical protein
MEDEFISIQVTHRRKECKNCPLQGLGSKKSFVFAVAVSWSILAFQTTIAELRVK